MKLRVCETETKYNASHVSLKSTVIQDKNGKEHNWEWVERNNTTKAVAIIPLFDNEEKKRTELILLKQFRVPVNDYVIEFPAGLVDKEGECEFDVAERELFEETGLTLGNPYQIGPQLYTSPGLTNESISYVVAHVFGEPSIKNTGLLEDISVLRLSVEEVKKLLISDDIKIDAKCFVWLNWFAYSYQWKGNEQWEDYFEGLEFDKSGSCKM